MAKREELNAFCKDWLQQGVAKVEVYTKDEKKEDKKVTDIIVEDGWTESDLESAILAKIDGASRWQLRAVLGDGSTVKRGIKVLVAEKDWKMPASLKGADSKAHQVESLVQGFVQMQSRTYDNIEHMYDSMIVRADRLSDERIEATDEAVTAWADKEIERAKAKWSPSETLEFIGSLGGVLGPMGPIFSGMGKALGKFGDFWARRRADKK